MKNMLFVKGQPMKSSLGVMDSCFGKKKLCIPNCFIWDLLERESYGGGLMKHFGVAKTLWVLQEHFY